MDTLYRFSSETLLKPLTSIITQNGMPMRKAFISLCIYQGLPSDPNSVLYEKTTDYITLVLPIIHYWPWDGECVEFFGLSVDPYIEIISSSFHMSDVLGYEYDVHEYRSRVAKIRKMT